MGNEKPQRSCFICLRVLGWQEIVLCWDCLLKLQRKETS